MKTPTYLSSHLRRIFVLCLASILITSVGCSADEASPNNDVGENISDVANDSGSKTDVSLPDGQLTDNAWNWIPVEGSKCGNGSIAGYGLMPRPDATKLVVYFNGGGACWDAGSCYVFKSASNIEVNYNEAHFRTEVATVGVNDFFGGASYAFFPYCTADLHAGNSVGQYDGFNPDRKVHHNGAVNTALYLEGLKQQYPNVKTLYVMGVSAGGYGAMFNYEKIREVFSDSEIHVLADSSPFVQPREGRWGLWKKAWKLILPSDCDTCAEKMPNVASHIIEKYPDTRFGLLSWEDDAVIMIFFAYPAGELGPAIRSFAAAAYAPDNASTFLVEGTDHVLLVRPPTTKAKNGQTLAEYLVKWAYP